MLNSCGKAANFNFKFLLLIFAFNLCHYLVNCQWLDEHQGWKSKEHKMAPKRHHFKNDKDHYFVKDNWMHGDDKKTKYISDGWKEKNKHSSGHKFAAGNRKHEHDYDKGHHVLGEKSKHLKEMANKEKKKGIKKHWNEGESQLKTFHWNKGKHFEKGHDNLMEKHRQHHGHGHKKVKDAEESMKDKKKAHLEKDRVFKHDLKKHKSHHEKESEVKKKKKGMKREGMKSVRNKEADWAHLESPGYSGHDSIDRRDSIHHGHKPHHDHFKSDKKHHHYDDNHGMKKDFDDELDFGMPKDTGSVSGLKDYFNDDFGSMF